MRWEPIIPGGQAVDPTKLAEQIIDVFHDGFGLPRREGGWSPKDAASMIDRCTIVQVLKDENGRSDRIEGYDCFVCPEAALAAGGHLLWEDGICIRKAHQSSGWGGRALTGALDAAARLGRNVRYLGGRTQNPHIIARYASWGVLFPLDESYETADGLAIMDFLLTHIREVQGPDRKGRLDRRTGVIDRIYKEGKLGDYDIPDAPRVAAWESWLQRNGFDRDHGDAVAIVAAAHEIPKHSER